MTTSTGTMFVAGYKNINPSVLCRFHVHVNKTDFFVDRYHCRQILYVLTLNPSVLFSFPAASDARSFYMDSNRNPLFPDGR
jgi:hypothetical protein